MRLLSLSVLFVCLVCVAPSARAQDTPPLASTPILLPPPPGAVTADERHALDTWVEAMRNWQHMDKRWHNEPAHDIFGRIVDRAPKPPAPEWLGARCLALGASVDAALPPLGPACHILAGIEDDPVARTMRTVTVATRQDREKAPKNTFLTRVHIDGLWTSTSSDARLYGLVGSHISLVDVGRVQFFGPPGVILLSVPDASGQRRIRPGYTWGMSIRLSDVRLFAPTKNLTLFLSITKVWVPGGTAYDRLEPGGFDIAGFSLAPRKRTE
jgi:hypothetical protein